MIDQRSLTPAAASTISTAAIASGKLTLAMTPERDGFRLNRRRALALWWSMIFSENRYPPIGSKPEGMLFRIML
jgi:hypothetical protein